MGESGSGGETGGGTAAPVEAVPQRGLFRASRTEFGRHRRRLLELVGPVYVALTVLGALNALLLVDESGADSTASATVIATALVVAGAFWTLPVVARGLADGRAGERPRLRSQLLASYRRVNTLSWLLLLSAVALILLPTVLVARWALAVPVAAAEDATVKQACRRSWRLTRGRLWRTLWLLVLTVAVVAGAASGALVAGFEAAGALDVSDEWTFMLSLVVSLAVAIVPLTLVSALVGVVWMTWYERQLLRTGAAAPERPEATAAGMAPRQPVLGAMPWAAVADAGTAAVAPDGGAAAAGAVPVALLPEAAATRTALVPAGFWRRGLAFLIDVAVVGLVGGGISGIVDAATGRTLGSGAMTGIVLGILAACWLVYSTALLAWLGQTIGKLALGVTVVDDTTGEHVGARAALGRELARLGLGFIPLAPLVDHLSALQVARKRTWHDRAAGTAVVRRAAP